jgi:hypothetical protein
MSIKLSKSTALAGVAAIALTLGLTNAVLAASLTVTDGDFTSFTGGSSAPKCEIGSPVTGGVGSCGLTSWAPSGTPFPNPNLVFVAGTAAAASAAGSTPITTYGNPSGSITGNYLEADGNPTFESPVTQTITGLTAGTTYTLNFLQGASQQTGFSGATTDQWIVSLGTAALAINCSTNPCTYSNSDATASTVASTLMTVPSEGTVGWNSVSVTLTADSTSDVLSFLAWGDGGSTSNLPPFAFLAEVGTATPLPATLPLFGVGLVGLGGLLRRRRRGQA